MERNKVNWFLITLAFILISSLASHSQSHHAQSGGSKLGSIERISIGPDNIQSNGISEWSTISGNGRFLAYHSTASNLVPNDTNNSQDVFLYDRLTRSTERLSLAYNGAEANNRSQFPDLSADGRYVSFHSEASNLILNDTNNAWDVFLRDRQTGAVELISISNVGSQGNRASYFPDISGDGRFITFVSSATNLVPNDTNGVDDIFLFDRQAGTIQQINVNGDGTETNAFSTFPDISPNGRYIVYESAASNLVPNDTNESVDVFLFDTNNQTTERISVNSAEQQGDAGSSYAIISADNRYVTYVSHATNIDPADPNNNGDIYLRDLVLGTTTLISTSTDGQPTNGESHYPFLSFNGRFIVYHSSSSNLVPGDTNNTDDIFLYDHQSGTTKRINLSVTGNQGDGVSANPGISWNGRIIMFQSLAGNLVPGDTNGALDIFLYLDLPYQAHMPAFFQ